MNFNRNRFNFVNFGDLLDVYHICRIHGLKFVFKNFHFAFSISATTKWSRIACSETDFWVIPLVKQRWNKLISGDSCIAYEDYVVAKYLNGLTNLKLLSIGCGNSTHEQNFSRHENFESVEGIDLSEKQIQKARKYAEEDGCRNIIYRSCDFEKENFPNEFYDLVLFHSSLHHFNNIETLIKNRIKPILKHGGLLILVEYTGPNRLQWTEKQLTKINELLKKLPPEYKTYWQSGHVKKKVYKPGLWRISVSDPSESQQSESILPAIHNYFEVLEEKKLGGNLIHPLLKGISHHFVSEAEKSKKILNNLFETEEHFVEKTGLSDFTFGVYRKM